MNNLLTAGGNGPARGKFASNCRPLACLFFVLTNGIAHSQDYENPFSLGGAVLSRGVNELRDAPKQIERFESLLRQGKQYSSEEECLGALQVAVVGSQILANSLPFSSVATLEDDRGPTARIRILFNGRKINLEAYCSDNVLSAAPLAWDDTWSSDVVNQPSTFDAVAGLALLLNAQGAFEPKTQAQGSELVGNSSRKPDVEVPEEEEPEPLANAQESDKNSEANIPEAPSEAQEVEPEQELALTRAEQDALIVSIQQCWNVGALSMEALRTTVVVEISLTQDGLPEAGSIVMVESDGETEAATRQAFEAARRAVIRCGARGFPLPQEKYEDWRVTRLVFDPNGMRLK